MANDEKTLDELRKVVKQQYQLCYPGCEVEVTALVDAFGGKLCVIAGALGDGLPADEMCFAHRDGAIRIFGTTEELAIFVAEKRDLKEFALSRAGIAAIFLALLLVVVVAIGLRAGEVDKLLPFLFATVGVVAGYLFNERKPA